MKKIIRNTAFAILLTVVLVLNQAVFLLFPINPTNAQYNSILGNTSNLTNTTNTTTDSNTTNSYPSAGNTNYTDPTDTLPISFTILESLQSPLSGTQDITVVFEGQDVDTVSVCIHGPSNGCLQKYDSYPFNYLFKWQTNNFPNGTYNIIIKATKGGQSESKTYNYSIQNDTITVPKIYPDPNEIISPPETGMETSVNIIKPLDGATISGWITIIADTYGPIRRTGFFAVRDGNTFNLGFGHYNGHSWEFGLDTGRYENNNYTIIAHAWDDKENKITSNKVSIEIKNDGLKVNYIVEQTQPTIAEFIYEDNTFYEEGKNYVNDYQTTIDYYPKEIKKDPIFIDQPIVELRDTMLGIPWECRKAGIANKDECEIYMFKLHMPYECKEAGAESYAECDKIMMTAHMPPECKDAGITNKDECETYLNKKYMPEECLEAGATTKEECDKITFKNFAPPTCLEEGIETEGECEKLLFNIDMPSDCVEAGIENDEACKKYMFEKYGGPENIPADKFPPECIKAGAQTIDECETVMQKMYMPRECQDNGITSEKECEIYMNKKYMPRECQEAGATTRKACDKIMFNKYSPIECRDKGLTSEKDCKEFMVNFYAPKVDCRGITDDQCRRYINDRHIGNIIAKQTKYDEIKKFVSGKIGKSLKIDEFKNSLDKARGIIPFRGKDTGVKIIATSEYLILNEDEKLIQTSPIALMIDSDQDGLPDEIEKRIGTDPFNADSDNDGFNDGQELKNNFNPLGEGRFEKLNLAPIEEAILYNRPLGQPKVEGETSEDLIVKGVDNIIDEQGAIQEGLSLKGQAEPNSVVTLYIYSDLPIVVTTKVDRYGNWEYELNESLIDGEHEVYVVLNDNTGRVLKKSNPLNFFIEEARAISVTDYVSAAVVAPEISQESDNLMKYFIIITFMAVLIGILLFVIFVIQKRKNTIKL